MPSALDYIPALAMGTSVSQITGVSADGFTAAGYAALIQALTGSQPQLVNLGGGKAQILLDQSQIDIMKKWTEDQVTSAIKMAKSPSNLSIDMGPFIIPTVLKYAVPAAAVLFIAGWIACSYLGRR